MRYNEPKRNIWSRLAEAGSVGLGTASNMVMPMYQQKMAQQRDQRDFDAEQQRFNQRMGQDESQFNQTMAFNREKIPPPKAPDVYNPPTAEAAWVNAQMSGNTSLADTFYKAMMEKNTYEDRQVSPKMQPMPPNVLGDANKGFGEQLTKWQNDMVYNTATEDPKDVMPNPNRGQEPTKAGYFQQNIAHTVPNLQQSYPQSFGPNASDSLYQGFTGQRPPQAQPTMLPRTGQWGGSNPTNVGQLTPNEDSWGFQQFGDEWRTADPQKKLAVIAKARQNGEL